MADVIDRLRRGLEANYRIDREIGHGGMATVFLAQDLRHGRSVAIKVLRPELGDALGAERFLREIRTVAQLAHPHILPLYDSGACNGLLYFVMPYVEGVSLRDRLTRDGPLSVDDALRVAREIADALAHAHALGLVHRDIKPENILFQAGHALLSDFGIARAVREAGGERLTESGMAVGTILYMSPEQAVGSGEVDARSDVYSLGCVLREMLTGEAPFGVAPVLSDASAAGSASGRVPPSVAKLVDVMMSRDPVARHLTGKGLLNAIDDAIARTRERPASRWTGRRVPIFLAASVVIIAGVAWTLSAARRPAIRSIAVLPPQDLSGDTSRRYLADGIHDALIGELASNRALRVVSRTSSAHVRTRGKSVPEIARELGVDAVVEASMMLNADRLTLRVHVIRARPEERDLGSDLFERDLRGALGLYRDAARAVGSRVGAPAASNAPSSATVRTVDPIAYDLYLRGMFALHNGSTAEDLARGLALLDRAIARDSTEPLPWAGVALAYDQLGHLGALPNAYDRARAAAGRAELLGEPLAETDAALAQTLLYDDWNPRAADSLFLRAIERNHSLPDALSHYGWSLLLSGQIDSAMASLQRAEEADPLTGLWPAFTASAASWTGRRNIAHAAISRAVALNDSLPITHYVRGTILALDGDFDGAIAAERKATALSRRWTFGLGYVLALAGQRDEARRIAAELQRAPDGLDAWGLAEIYSALGEPDQAFHWLDVSRRARWNWIPWVDFDPAFAGLRDDPRFAAFRREVGAPRCGSCAGKRPASTPSR